MSNSSCVCLPRLVVRTSGFHPDNMGSIPVGDAKDLDTFKVFFFYLGVIKPLKTAESRS